MVAEAQAANERLRAAFGEPGDPWATDLAETRRLRSDGGAGFPPPVRVEGALTDTVPMSWGDMRVRSFGVDAPVAAMLYLHGGGWNTGDVDQQDVLLDATARAAGIAVTAVSFRLAPEHPYPAPVLDAVEAMAWFETWAPTTFRTDRLVLAGDSTGAHLALTAALHHLAAPSAENPRGFSADNPAQSHQGIRDSVGYAPNRHRIGAQWVALDLTVGIYDLGLTPFARNWGSRPLLLSTPIIEWFVELFTPGRSLDERRDPAVSPLHAPHAQLALLPPTILTAAAEDPLRDDSVLLAAALAAAGVPVDLAVWPEANHAFFVADGGLADLALDRRTTLLRALLGGTP